MLNNEFDFLFIKIFQDISSSKLNYTKYQNINYYADNVMYTILLKTGITMNIIRMDDSPTPFGWIAQNHGK